MHTYREFPSNTNGPDHLHAGPQCTDVLAGNVEQFNDCCCCDPCRSAKFNGKGGSCCRCAPAMLCCTFVPDAGQECCKSTALFALARVEEIEPSWIFYFGDPGLLGSFAIAVSINKIHPGVLDSNCQWRLTATGAYTSDETWPLDRTNGGCLVTPDDFSVSGITISGCIGTLVITVYEPVKLPFVNRFQRYEEGNRNSRLINIAIGIHAGYAQGQEYEVEGTFTPVESPCNCEFATEYLCVGGVRHHEGEVEYVTFSWNRELGDRWEYCPPELTPDKCITEHKKETIYLRGDSYGNCFLELDFEQSGKWTNDWAEPPNYFDYEDPHDIFPTVFTGRQGLIPVDDCGCGMIQDARTDSGDRFIRIHAGSCSRYEYVCGNCRCIPPQLCLIGQLGGDDLASRQEVIQAIAEWDGSGWYSPELGLRFTIGGRSGRGPEGGCTINVTSDAELLIEFDPSLPIQCGNFLTFQVSTPFDPAHPYVHNFIWGTGTACAGCYATPACGPCKDRCGQSPTILHIHLVEGIRVAGGGFPALSGFECTLDVEVHFWTNGFPNVVCGYVGQGFYTCNGILYRVVATMLSLNFRLQLVIFNTIDNSYTTKEYPYSLDAPDTCEPYSFYRELNPAPGMGAYYSLSVTE